MKQVHLHIQSIPIYTPAGHSLFAAGDFNNWKTGDEHFRFEKNADGTFSLRFETDLSVIEFRCNRGDWQLAEGDEYAKPNPVRRVLLREGKNIIPVHISSWIDFAEEHSRHTASTNVLVIAHDFFIPQLNRTRRITAYLPADYWSTQKQYPVLYMQDGQNIFDSWQTFSGEWNVDETLDRFFYESKQGVIVIGVDNGGEKRLDEYAPWMNLQEGGGEGSAYADFIVQTLKPFIDTNFRTRPGREHTAIMGSSMGGLISLYTALKYQDVFGMAAVFSPSLWFTQDIYRFVRMKGSLYPQRFMLLAGGTESDVMTGDMLKLYFTMKDAGFNTDNIHFDIHKDGAHSEWFWGREFLTGLEKISIFENDMPGEQQSISPVIISYNKDQQYLQLKVDQRVVHPAARVSDESGKQVTSRALFYCTNYMKLPAGNEPFVVELFNEGKPVYSFRVNEAAQLQMTG